MMDFDIVIKYFAGKAGPEEAMQIEEWAAASEEHRAFFHTLHQSWLEAGGEQYHIPDVRREWEAFNDKHRISGKTQQLAPPRKVWLSRVAAAAAIVAVAFAGFYVFNSKNQNEPTRILVAKEKTESIKLDDGSQISVEPEGELVYPAAFKKEAREVTLVGSGSFAVMHKPEQPFIVHMGALHVKVLGTSFSITRARKEVSVKVSSGKVAFYNDKDTLFIAGGETGKYLKAERKFLLEKAAPLTGSFHFNNTPLNEVAGTLSAYFHVEIRLINRGLERCKLSAGFENQSLEDILKDISATFNLQYKTDTPYIDINGPACE